MCVECARRAARSRRRALWVGVLRQVANNAFARVTYTEAVAICAKVSGPKAGVAWEYTP